MQYCKECGEKQKDDNNFCWKCGAKLQENPPVKGSSTIEPVREKTTKKTSIIKTSKKESTAKKPEPKQSKTLYKDPITSKTNTKATIKKTAAKKPVAKKLVVIKPKKKEKELTHKEKTKVIYEMTSKDNCGECGCKNCLQFAMKAASENNSMELNDCPYIDVD